MAVLRVLEGLRSPALDWLFALITSIGEETVAILLLSAIFWCIDKRLAYAVGLTYFISGLLVQGMKIGFRIERPWVLDPSFAPVAAAIEHATGYSFPSGHTQSAAAVFGTLGFSLKKTWQKTLCFILVVLVGFSRMYLGVHTLADVGVSLAIGLAVAYVIVRFFMDDIGSGDRKQAYAAATPAVIAVLSVCFSLWLYSSGIIEQAYVADMMKMAGSGIGFAVGMSVETRYIRFSVICSKLPMQIVKCLAGIAGVLAIKEGVKLIAGTSLVMDTLRYFLMGLWMTALFALIIRKWFQENKKPEQG